MKELNISLETPNKLSTTSHAKGDLEVNISCLAWIEHLRDVWQGRTNDPWE